ncbi:hypothetical protein PssvBMR4_gp50 [Pseudomonas phage MR4]|uniref:Uncharacterized protein n=1 Tax=Pseudomonas phage MR4 TaxID=2711171 RepID=A0A6M3T971_9CAUD|nr:hypothetical protein PssvBMR4_gp50 [Pseudomonas phage MR4]
MEVSCSSWCQLKWQEAVESGDDLSASNYLKLYELWSSRGM